MGERFVFPLRYDEGEMNRAVNAFVMRALFKESPVRTFAPLALIALSLPPLLVLGVSAFYNRMETLAVVQDFSRGLGMAVVGLTIAVSIGLASSTIVDWRGIVIATGALALAISKRLPVILILVLAILAVILAVAWLR